MKRAQAEALGGAIVIGIIVVILLPLILGMFLETQKTTERLKAVASFQAERLSEKIIVDWLPITDDRYPGFYVNNTGTVTVEVKTLFLIDTATHRIVYAINLTEYTPGDKKPITKITLYPGGRVFAKGRLILRPGEAALFQLNGDRAELRKITVSAVMLSARGVVHPTGGVGFDRRLLQAGEAERATTAVMLEPKIVFLNFTSLRDLLSPESPVELATTQYFNRVAPTVGIVVYDSGGRYGVYSNVTQSSCTRNCSVNIQNSEYNIAVIGYTPGSTNKFNILLTYRVPDRGATYVWYRVKIEGLNVTSFAFTYKSSDGYFDISTNNIAEALGFWYYANTVGEYGQPRRSVSITGRITIVGVADRVTYYRLDWQTTPALNNYEPFLFIADTDGNGYGEVILVTEDYEWGYVNPPDVKCFADEEGNILAYSALISGGKITHSPWNPLGGFTFRLKGVTLDPRRVISVYVMARVYYHDTELGQLGDCVLTPYPIMRFLLVDENWNVLAFKDITYNELVAVASESTWPPNRQYVVLSATLAVPITDARVIYVAVSMIDPFKGNGADDLDLTLGVEIIGVIPYARG